MIFKPRPGSAQGCAGPRVASRGQSRRSPGLDFRKSLASRRDRDEPMSGLFDLFTHSVDIAWLADDEVP
jgi:hypothetical protein